MDSLPAICAGDAVGRLPLSDTTAVRLSEALLADESSQRIEILRETLLADPALAVWTAASAWRRDRRELATATEASCWLAGKLLPALVWDADTCAVGLAQEESPNRWASVLRQSFLSGTFQSDDSLFDKSRWQHFIRHTSDWLTVCGQGQREVAQPLDEDHPGCKLHVEHWMREIPGAAAALRLLCEKLRRLNSLEDDFQRQLHREKLASLKEFSYGASHELNNPLFNISSRAQLLLRDETDPERRRKLATIHSHALRASEMIQQMALAARPPKPEMTPIDLVEIIEEVVEELRDVAREQGAVVRRDEPGDRLDMVADATQIAVALRELGLNSLASLKRAARAGVVVIESRRCQRVDAVRRSENEPQGSWLQIDVRDNTPFRGAKGDSQGGWLQIGVRDNGSGLDERCRRHLFDPFFSGYESGRGLGFGLSKVWQIVEAHGGTIEVESEPDRGTTFIILLPTGLPANEGGQSVEPAATSAI